VGGPLPTSDEVRQLTLPPNFERFEIVSAVLNYYLLQITFNARRVAGVYRSGDELGEAFDELKRVLEPISNDELHLLIDPFVKPLVQDQDPPYAPAPDKWVFQLATGWNPGGGMEPSSAQNHQ
jgi:hypothetical protein